MKAFLHTFVFGVSLFLGSKSSATVFNLSIGNPVPVCVSSCILSIYDGGGNLVNAYSVSQVSGSEAACYCFAEWFATQLPASNTLVANYYSCTLISSTQLTLSSSASNEAQLCQAAGTARPVGTTGN